MRFFIKLIIAIFVIAAASYGYMWYKNKSIVDSIITDNGGSYKNTYVDLNGDSVINDINFPIPGDTASVKVSNVRIGAGSLVDNLKIYRAYKKGDQTLLPKSFKYNVNLSRLDMPMDFDNFDNQGDTDILSKIFFSGCGDKKSLEASDLNNFGINSLLGDMNFSLSLDQYSNNFVFNADVFFDKLQSGKIQLDIKNFSFDNPMNVKLRKGMFEVSDNGMQSEIYKMCAKKQGMSLDEYKERHIAYLKHLLFQENLFFSPEFYEGYSKYYSNPQTIKLSFMPTQDYSPTEFFVGMQNIPSFLRKTNAELFINNKAIAPLYGNRPDPSELPSLDIEAPEEEIKYIRGLTIQPTAVSQMGKYVGYDAFFSYRGKKYKGQIQSVSGGTATVKYELTVGNTVAKPFAMKDISNLRIRREFSSEVKNEAEKAIKEAVGG